MPLSGPQSLLADLAKLESLRDPQRCEGKRQYQRFIVRGDAELTCMDHGRIDVPPVVIQLRDVGRGGLGFLCQQEFEPLSTWRVSFLHNGYVIGQQAMIIRFCRQVRPGAFLAGGQFCIESGLMCLLGIDPASISDGDSVAKPANPPKFLSPGEVA